MNEVPTFGSWLKRRRKELGLAQPSLALRVACSVQTVNKIETGKRRPSEQMAERLAECLDIPLEEHSQFVEFARAQLTDNQFAQLVRANATTPWRVLKSLQHPNNLPTPLNGFIGREREVKAACALLRRPEVRLLTFTGPPGVGKTRLALQLASSLIEEDHFADGVFFVPLAPVTDANSLISAIARTLRVHEAARQLLLERLKAYLRDKQILLVLDNFEQILEAAALVSELLGAAPNMKALVTSRVVLRIYGEHHFQVPPLSLPNGDYQPPIEVLPHYESVRLFIERAQAARPDFVVTNENVLSVVEICQRLDGLPLAIELAAARVKLLSPQAMLERLSRSLSSSLQLLTGGAGDLPDRQRTLRGAIEWSYHLLDDAEKKLFTRLSVFAGGCTLEAIEAVCGPVCSGGSGQPSFVSPEQALDVLDCVEALVGKSLLQQLEGVGGEPRFLMLETLHEYAQEKLEERGEGEELQRRHAEYFRDFAEGAEPQLTGPEQATWLACLEEEYDNLRAALGWSREKMSDHVRDTENAAANANTDADMGLRIAGALWRFWYSHGHLSEGREQLVTLLSLTERKGGGVTGARAVISKLPSIASAKAKALVGAGWLAWIQGDYDATNLYSKESLAIYRELGDKQGIASSLTNLAVVAHHRGDHVSARSLNEGSLALKRELGDNWGIAASLNHLGVVARDQGDPQSAASLFEESVAMRRELGDNQALAISLANLGNTAKDQGDYVRAGPLYKESLALFRELGDRLGISMCLADLGTIAALRGIVERAARLWGAAQALREVMGTPLWPFGLTDYEESLATARGQLDEATWVEAWEEGRTMSMEQAIAYALQEAKDS